ncbi:MAG: hypothetical protein ACRD1H_03450, partial [Vicinamibacterales bacterium]
RVLLFDLSRPLEEDDLRLRDAWPDAIRIAHKCDLSAAWSEQSLPAALCVSSRTGAGIDARIKELVQRLVPAVPPPGTPMPVTQRQASLVESALAALRAGDEAAYRSALRTCLDV